MREFLRYINHYRRLVQLAMQPLRKELDLSQLDLDLLLFLYNNPELNTARDAVTYRGFAKSNVSTAVETLTEKGWLTVEPDPESRRIKRLVLCPGRQAELGRLAEQQAAILNRIGEGFTQEELRQFREALARMDQNMTKALEEWEGKGHD